MSAATARRLRIASRRSAGWFERIGGGMSVLEGVQREIDGLPLRFRELGLAALALAMARNIDNGKGSPSECGKVLMDALKELRAIAPAKKEKDVVDQLAVLRTTRRASIGSAASSDRAGS